MLVLFALLSLSCSPGTDFEESCAGEVVVNCLPYEASVIRSATLTPAAAEIGDTSIMVHLRIELDICAAAPRPHEVTMRMRVGEGGDAQLLDLLMLRDDGMTEGDAVASDGVIDIDIVNPFVGSMIPANADVFLRFGSRALVDCSSGTCRGGTCRSEAFEIPYRTGPDRR